MATLNQRFGKNLEKLRKRKGVSQMKLAQKSGLDLTTINELENGNRNPMLKTVWKIANALGMRTSDLVDF